VGFFSDAYDLFNINLVKNVMADLYPQTADQASALGTAAIVGAVLGQLVFGTLADRIGRKVIFITTLTLVILGSLGSATVVDSTTVDIYTQLCIWRGILGFGIGGEYPLSATVTSEKAGNKESRGRSIAFVFSMQGIGNVAACLLMFAFLKTSLALDIAWRLSLALGALPGLLTIYWRYKMEETHHFKHAQRSEEAARSPAQDGAPSQVVIDTSNPPGRTPEPSKHVSSRLPTTDAATIDTSMFNGMSADASTSSKIDGQVAAPQAASQSISSHWEGLRTIGRHIVQNRRALLGTAGSWFLFDVVYYGHALFTGTVLGVIGFSSGKTGSQTEDQLAQLALGSLILAFIGLPGYFVSVALINRVGRRPMQLGGFVAVGVLFIILASALRQLQEQAVGAFIFIYGLTFFFSNFGPNMTTFVIPAEAFPTAARATCHGISAASGKIGAAIGAAAMAPLLTAYGTDYEGKLKGLTVVLSLCAVISFLGAGWTWWLTGETGHHDLQVLDTEAARAMKGEPTTLTSLGNKSTYGSTLELNMAGSSSSSSI
jgi:PHS family inorganic phosphate transporter-like MFS transporter